MENYYITGSVNGAHVLHQALGLEITKENASALVREKLIVLKDFINEYHQVPYTGASGTCAFCHLRSPREFGCKSCPVFEVTGEEHCENTDYYNYADCIANDRWEPALQYIDSMLNVLDRIDNLKGENT